MPNPEHNLNINQNATFKMSFQLKDSNNNPIDIVSWSFSGSLKEKITDPDPPLLFFTASVADLTQSIVNISLTPAQTTLLTERKYVYDIIATNYSTTPDEVYRILEGYAFVDLGVTDPSVTE